MKTIITTDNYEAYLLDYMEGNLSPDEAEQLKAFVAAQGLDWDELTEELPHLEAPQITYEGKESLKKKATIVPLYVKIASAAAAAGLLLTVSLWPEKSMPKMEPVAELKPILPTRLITSEENQTLPPRTISFVVPQPKAKKQPKPIRTETTLLANLQPVKAEETPIVLTTTQPEDSDLGLMAYHLDSDFAYARNNEDSLENYAEDDDELSLVSKGILLMTNGRHDSFASLISTGLITAKKEISLAVTDMALTAYNNVSEQIEEAKEHWEEKLGE